MDESALRERITNSLLRKIEEETYPSTTMLNRVETALKTPDDVGRYAEILLEKIDSTRYPSTDMLSRLDRLLARLA